MWIFHLSPYEKPFSLWLEAPAEIWHVCERDHECFKCSPVASSGEVPTRKPRKKSFKEFPPEVPQKTPPLLCSLDVALSAIRRWRLLQRKVGAKVFLFPRDRPLLQGPRRRERERQRRRIRGNIQSKMLGKFHSTDIMLLRRIVTITVT